MCSTSPDTLHSVEHVLSSELLYLIYGLSAFVYDCKWTDGMRAQWFSWFLTGSAKSTWQRTLNREDKQSWSSMVQAYKKHYGVHMDPRTAYLRCHELQYQDFKSAQGLLESMKDYQRTAPDQLSNTNLISMLCNKVPVTLQKEMGEYKDWYQTLFSPYPMTKRKQWSGYARL